MSNDEKKFCYRYPHPAVTADCIIFGTDGDGCFHSSADDPENHSFRRARFHR